MYSVSMEVGGQMVWQCHGKHELLGRMHVDVCEGKPMEDSIRGVRQVWVINHMHKRTLLQNTEERG